jgi:hypothetical protein
MGRAPQYTFDGSPGFAVQWSVGWPYGAVGAVLRYVGPATYWT